MIRLQQLSKVFQARSDSIRAVDNVDLSINTGEIFGVIGYSGAGKSTLIRMLNMLERPSAGNVTVADWNMADLSGRRLREARQEISMIFQHFNLLWSRTVKENIAFPLEIAGVSKQKRAERVEELTELVGLSGRGDAYPSQLSGGQKQRVGIARALANNPKVLLCDEATSALDPKTTDSILDLLTDINKKLGLTIVLITHEMHVIRKICHRVAVMDGGKVVEQGLVIDVFRNPEQDMTKEFVKQVTEPEETLDALKDILKSSENGLVVKLMFLGEDAEQPVMTDLIRTCGVAVNILQGKVSKTRDGSYGTLFVQLQGNKEELDKAWQYLQEHRVEAEVLNDV
ncbi:D-methionine transport system ATP-binding protein [Alteribacillus persepolensis]|uniref:D-methionine transport system ATP-binding protein n=1 Tax=Alteribacillus persepolensis TaxID=568899 RepID=A0A1G8DUZ3_9BACI|nr:methionine ABC transporter ATP-binding protein [Alteribacillus persepolensis]SDH61524.1 D-methionine transport system ATP-binding protein [Alteribacillus persepolensis]